MNNYFYPIYKSNLKPWIKYWLIKRLSGEGESELKVVTISSGKIFKVDKTKPLSVKEYYGNTIQDGTPTPETPVEVQTISGDNEFFIGSNTFRVDLGGKNLLSFDGIYNVNNGTKGTDKLTSTTNTSVGAKNLYFYLNPTISFKNGETVYISADIRLTEGSTGTWGEINNNVTNFTSVVAPTISTTYQRYQYKYTYSADSTQTQMLVQVTNLVGSFEVTNIMISKSADITYSPYVSNPIELCKIGNYQDKIVNDNGTWKLEKNIGKVVLDSTYRQSGGTTGTNAYYITTKVTTLNDNTKELSMSNMFQPCSFNDRANGLDIIYCQSGSLIIRTANNTSINWSDNTNRDNWLNANKPICYYVLATPTYTVINDNYLTTQLEALGNVTVNSSTVIISNDSEIPFEIKIEYYGR